MASLQVRHSRSCATGKPWTPSDKLDGCTCYPTFYVVVREGTKVHREKAGKNRKQAERALTKAQGQEDDGSYRAPKNIRFEKWADEWIGSLERPKANTIDSYRPTMDYAKDAFGWKIVRRLGVDDVKDFLSIMREAEISESTRAKHLRVLSACLRSAVANGYAVVNPAKEIPDSERPQARDRTRESAYFADEELPRLFAELDGLYLTIARTALMTGIRSGELAALRWGDCDLIERVIHVRRNYTHGRETTPKSFTSKRDVHLPSSLVDLLGAWWGECGKPGDDKLVFPGQTASGYLSTSAPTKQMLYPAMTRAGIPREGPTGEKRTFHSFRHSFARIALENGRSLEWLSRHLGHSSITVTYNIYGHFSKEASRREIEELEEAFAD